MRIVHVQQTPEAPPSPATPRPFVVNVGQSGTLTIPQTAAELQALRAKREQLSDQLISAASRRKGLADQLRSSDPAGRPGIEARMRVLDDRIVRLEQEIDRTGDALANTPGAVLAMTSAPAQAAEFARNIPDNIVPIVAILSVFVLSPFAITLSRFIWKRSLPAPRAAVTDQAAMQRLEQLQQSVDTIAIEVERISEGQRFVTRLLSERDREALGAGVAEPVRTPQKASIPSERG